MKDRETMSILSIWTIPQVSSWKDRTSGVREGVGYKDTSHKKTKNLCFAPFGIMAFVLLHIMHEDVIVHVVVVVVVHEAVDNVTHE